VAGIAIAATAQTTTLTMTTQFQDPIVASHGCPVDLVVTMLATSPNMRNVAHSN
jgi:hypothetical protein